MAEEPSNPASSPDRPYRVYRGDSAPRGGSRGRNPAPGAGSEAPPYKVYRSGPRGLRSRLRGEDDTILPGRDGSDDNGRSRKRAAGSGPRIRPRRVLKWLAVAIVAWLLLSAVLFLISASEHTGGTLPASTKATLTSGGNMLTSASTILILGTDQRPRTGPGSKEPGSHYNDAGSNSDTIMLWRVGGGVSRRLSIPRDTATNIPTVGLAKINAAYSAGGPTLALKTIEQFTGIRINHMIVINLGAFPKFIDDIGGVTITTGRVCSEISGGAKKGGFSLFLRPGSHTLTGIQALTLARTREDRCNAAVNDLTREGYQQKILNAIKGQLLTPAAFFHLPWASWDAPQTLRTDMGGLTLLSLFAAAELGGSAPTQILKPSGSEVLPNGGDALTVTPGAVHRAIAKLIG